MAQPYVGEIRMFAGNFAPAGWMFCEGQLLPISENETLFQLIGTTYGGDGESTFALPDLRGRIPLHQGNGFILAETGGAEEITLTVNQIPRTRHPFWRRPTPRSHVDAAEQRAWRSRPTARPLRRRTRPTRPLAPIAIAPVGRQPAAHQLPAVPVRQLHHLAVRHLPVADLGDADMADPFVAEIRIFPFNFAPKGWAWCDGQLLPLSQNTALFSLLGTTYGGDGKSNFALPDLQGRAPMHPARARACRLHDLGETGGSETVTLLESEIPAHTHALRGDRRRSATSSTRPATLARAASSGNAYQAADAAALVQHGARGARARRRRPAAQQPAAVPDALLLHRPPGRLPAPPDVALRPDPPGGRRAVPAPRLREHARRGARPVPWTAAQKAAFLRSSSRRQTRTTPSTTPA